ncbi:MAG: oligosaccharide flippase family protein, partial [Candidatus Omnitrophica bacterium]|nr:oligosaccharide flippase family protein [Candidatus Omnitrophota bacterium]
MEKKINQSQTYDVRGLSFAGLAVQTFAASIICQVIYLAISILSARILGPQGKGILTVVILYPTLLFTFGHLSIYRAITVNLAEKKFKFEDFPASILYFTVFLSVILICVFIVCFFVFNKYFTKEANFLIIMIALAITPCMMLLQAFYSILQVKGKVFEFNLAQILHTALILVFLFVLLVIFKAGVNGAVIAYSLAAFAAALIAIGFVRKISKETWKFNLKLLKT